MALAVEYWFLLPIGVIIATIAMATGIEGGMLWMPVYSLVVGLTPSVAVGMALLTKAFGFTTGLYFHSKKGTIDYRLGTEILKYSIPFAILGTILSKLIGNITIKIVFGVFLVLIGLSLFRKDKKFKANSEFTIIKSVRTPAREFSVLKFKKLSLHYVSAVGGLLLGLISIGLGPLVGFALLKNKNENIKVIVSTTIFIVASTTIAASVTNLIIFLFQRPLPFSTFMSLLAFAIPGVLIGAKFGTEILHYISAKQMKHIVAGLTVTVGALLVLITIVKGIFF